MENQNYKNILERVQLKIGLEHYNNEIVIKKSKHKKYYLNIIFVFLFCTIISTLTYATILLNKTFNANSSDGIDSAVDNEYIYFYNDNEYVESEGIYVKVESVLIDDYNLSINFDFKMRDDLKEQNIVDIWINDMVIVDEDNNIVFDGTTSYSYLTESEENYYKVSFNSPSNIPYQKSKSLIISFSKIKLDYNTDISGDETMLNGNWKISVDVPKFMYNRESITYKVKNCNDNNTNVKKAILSNTALKFEMTTTSDKIDFDLAFNFDLPIPLFEPIYGEYIENQKGEKFYLVGKSDDDGYTYMPPSKDRISCHRTFDITIYDATPILTVHLPTNSSQEIIIELEKES